MTYILIIIVGVYGGTQVDSIEFYTNEACNKAMNKIVVEDHNRIKQIMCVEKGEENERQRNTTR